MAEEKKDNTKLYSILAYIGILWLVGLIADKDNEVVKFHVNQGIWLCIVGVVLSIVCVGPIIMLIFAILGIVNVCRGDNDKYLPLFDKLPKIIK